MPYFAAMAIDLSELAKERGDQHQPRSVYLHGDLYAANQKFEESGTAS